MADSLDPSKLGISRAPENETSGKPHKRMRVEVTEQEFDSAFQRIMEGNTAIDSEGQAVIRKGKPLPEGQKGERGNLENDSPHKEPSYSDMDIEESNVEYNSDNRASELLINKAVAANSIKNINDSVSTLPDPSNKEKDRNVRSRDPSMTNVMDEDKEIYTIHDNSLKKCTQQQPRPTITRYDSSYQGKAKITIKLPPEQTSARKGKNLIKMWMYLTNIRVCPISLEMLNHFSAEAEFLDYLDANEALEKIEKIPNKIRAFMEQRAMINKGVIADWPSSIKDLWSVIQDRSGIIGLERMYRRKWDNMEKKTILSETDNIIVTFKGVGIRDLKIFSNNVGLKVRPFVPQTRQCFNCFRFGHTKISCKSETYCIACGDKAHGQCDKPIKCRNCGGSHKSTFRNCPVFEKNKQINVIMAHKNISFFSARRIVEGGDRGVPPADVRMSEGSWPRLPSPRTVSYAESARDNSAGNTGASVPRPPEHKRRSMALDRGRPPTTNSNQEYYKQFDLRAGVINKQQQGIMLASARNGAAWSNAYSSQTAGETPPVSQSSQVSLDIDNDMREILPLLRLFKELMERMSDGGKSSLNRFLNTKHTRELENRSESIDGRSCLPPTM